MPSYIRYVWVVFSKKKSLRVRELANTFRIVQAFSMSVPLILLHIRTLLDILQTDDADWDLANFKKKDFVGNLKPLI